MESNREEKTTDNCRLVIRASSNKLLFMRGVEPVLNQIDEFPTIEEKIDAHLIESRGPITRILFIAVAGSRFG